MMRLNSLQPFFLSKTAIVPLQRNAFPLQSAPLRMIVKRQLYSEKQTPQHWIPLKVTKQEGYEITSNLFYLILGVGLGITYSLFSENHKKTEKKNRLIEPESLSLLKTLAMITSHEKELAEQITNFMFFTVGLNSNWSSSKQKALTQDYKESIQKEIQDYIHEAIGTCRKSMQSSDDINVNFAQTILRFRAIDLAFGGCDLFKLFFIHHSLSKIGFKITPEGLKAYNHSSFWKFAHTNKTLLRFSEK